VRRSPRRNGAADETDSACSPACFILAATATTPAAASALGAPGYRSGHKSTSSAPGWMSYGPLFREIAEEDWGLARLEEEATT
jgi:hypothetical protein